jgi:hypothetical protein
MLPVSLACPFLIAWWFSLTSVTFINMNVPIFVKKELFVKTSIPIFKITTFQFVLTCHYCDIKNMHIRAVECAIVWLRWVYVYQCSLCCLSSPEFVSLKTRPEVRRMQYKSRLEFIVYLRSVWLFPESIAVIEVVFSVYCRQFGACINFLQCSRVIFSICPKPQFSARTMHRTVYNTLRKPPHWPQCSVKTINRTVYNVFL